MTPEQHNKYVALAHLAYASIHMLLMGLMLSFFGIVLAGAARDGRGGSPPIEMLFLMGVFVAGMTLIFTGPSLFASYAFWKRKPWAKTAGIVAAVMAAMNFPVGVATCVYTFWFLFSDPGKILYDNVPRKLPPPPPTWEGLERSQTRNYANRTPPDWR